MVRCEKFVKDHGNCSRFIASQHRAAARPQEIYNRPANTCAARFNDSPPINLVDAILKDGIHLLGGPRPPAFLGNLPAGGQAPVGLRPEQLTLSAVAAPKGKSVVSGRVIR